MAPKLLLFSCVAFQLLAQGWSEADTNACVECTRTPAACRRISGLYTVTTLTKGTYNPVVDIPAPACSINITEFRASNNYIGIKTKSNQGIINSYWGLGQPGHYYGAGARFTYDRGSGTCKGSCFRSEGPTTETIVVQILYYDKNPGIAYEFILPNHIPFTPYQTAISQQSGARSKVDSGDELTSSSNSTLTSTSEQHHRRHPRKFRVRQRPTRLEEKDFGGEYYTGSQYSRSEGRPDFTSALEAPEVQEVARKSQRFDYNGANYGTHNLGGQGQSYTSGRGSPLNELVSDSAQSGRSGSVSAVRHLPTTRDKPRIISRYRNAPASSSKTRTSTRNSPSRTSGRNSPARTSSSRNSHVRTSARNTPIRTVDRNSPPRTASSRTSPVRTSSSRNSPVRTSARNSPVRTAASGLPVRSFVRTSGSKSPVRTSPSNSPYNNVLVRKSSAPKYISNTRSSSYRRQYQPHTAQQTFDNTLDSGYDNVVRNFESSNQISSITRPLSASQSRQSVESYRWKISGFSECSKTCGGGVQTTNVVCVSTGGRNVVVVTSENCQHSRRPRTQTVACSTQPCDPAWEAEKWSACSVTCGSGTQTRTVECRQHFSARLTLRRSADQCGLDNKPAVAQQCEEPLCTQWETGSWGQCSKECGGGQQTRSVYCMDQTSHQVPANYCTETAPRQSQPCHTHKCSSQWWLSSWSKECSESCGQGTKSRRALCMNDSGGVVSDRNCVEDDKPKLEEACSSGAACRGLWFAGPWGRCSSSCGDGTRRRHVVCMQRSNGRMEIVHHDKCDASLRPDTREACSNDDCNVNWFTSDWSECSATCGDGVRTRETRCIEDRSSSTSCPASLKPHTREVCSTTACSDYQRTEIKYNERAERKRQRTHRGRSTSAPEINTPRDCRDTFYNCRVVAQSRLCSYSYYKKICCQTCHRLKHSRH